MTVIFVTLRALAVISFCILSPMSGYIAVPPDSTVLAHRSLGCFHRHHRIPRKNTPDTRFTHC